MKAVLLVLAAIALTYVFVTWQQSEVLCDDALTACGFVSVARGNLCVMGDNDSAAVQQMRNAEADRDGKMRKYDRYNRKFCWWAGKVNR